MKYTLIKGTFHVVGYSPDGDSLMFKANNRARWGKITTEHAETLQAKLDQGQGTPPTALARHRRPGDPLHTAPLTHAAGSQIQGDR